MALFPRTPRDFTPANPQPYRDRIKQIVPAWFMQAIGKTYDNIVPGDFALDTFHARIFPSRFNWLRGDIRSQVDVNIQRSVSRTEKTQLEFSVDLINALNRVVWDLPNVDATSSNFGKVTAQWNTPRWIQFKARLRFCRESALSFSVPPLGPRDSSNYYLHANNLHELGVNEHFVWQDYKRVA